MDAGRENVGAGGANLRQRFYVELKPGETNVVSLKKLRREAGEAVSDDSSDDYEAEKYIRVELPKEKKSGALPIQDKAQYKTGRIEYYKSTDYQAIKKRKKLMEFVGEEDDIQVDTKPKKKENQLIKTAAESAVSINGILKAQEFNLQRNRCKGDFQSPLNSSGGLILKKHSDAISKFIPGNNVSFTSAADKKFKGKQLIKTAAETAISINGNSMAQEFNIRNDRCKGDVQTPLHSSGGVILKKHSDATSKLITGNSISFTSVAHQKFKGKKSTQHVLHPRRAMSKNIEQEGLSNIKRKSNKGRNELPDLNLPYSGHAPRTASAHMTNGRKTGNKLVDWSILQLEKLVENSNTAPVEVQGADSLLDIEKQMSPELKEKLAKVARLTQLHEGKISEEVIDRLMGILGKYLPRKTLKEYLGLILVSIYLCPRRILWRTVLEDLYASKAECKNFEQIKMELVRMIRLQAPSLHVKVFSAEVTKGTYSMGDHLEDKLCELYDIFTRGLDEDIGPSLVRKLYAKLAELWPKGTMDNHEIRKAICRAKERKVVLTSEEEKGHQRTKKRKLSARMDETIHVGKSSSTMQRLPTYRNVTTDTSGLTRTSANRRLVSSMLTVDLPLTAPSSISIPLSRSGVIREFF